MSENLKTIRELAEELGVSKQAIQYHIKYLTNKDRQTNDKGIVVLSIEEQRFIRSRVDKQTNKRTNKNQANGFGNKKEWNVDQYLLSEIEDVRKNRDKQLAVKDKQLENKDLQISQLQNLLDQQQRLALQDKQLIEEYKAEIKDLKALAIPSHEVEKYVSPQSETESAEAQAKPKKWWQFKKRGQKND
ncbi:MarR family transcriptional regulator [Periweissella fabalis]|uniref:DNA-binding protein n=1 Tax=Periweissella fabalis TaxID=1070421 RepID=A0A7X6N5G6_9LACO|nr:helix-turn-helix domain-containing protein [Periweissella fabalis]MCM0598329.1 DNA-binding protein [Periweissella fabalis]NKZ24989.1 DNA-binding protein [Periweissella fabalis]